MSVNNNNPSSLSLPSLVSPGRISTQSATSTIYDKDGVTIPVGLVNTDRHVSNDVPSQEDSTESHTLSYMNRLREIVRRQLTRTDNRYAFQMGVAFLVATMFVVVQPIAKFLPNAFWVGVSVVTVLDNTVGGFLALSIQRMMGTIIGGGLSIVVMTVTRAIFPDWSWKADIMLCALMFCQVFTIAKIKLRPNMNYAGGIGLSTTVIILLSGYPDLIKDRLLGSARLGFWRTFDLVIGIIIAMWASLCIFPLKARHTMRKNLGEALLETARLYERTAVYCLDLSKSSLNDLPLSLRTAIEKQQHNSERVEEDLNLAEKQQRASIACPHPIYPVSVPLDACKESTTTTKQSFHDMSQDMEHWNHELVNELCDKAFKVLASLQTEATRLRSVSKEYYLQVPIHLLFRGGREVCRRDLRRTRQYGNAIEAMKRIVWPLVSFRLLLPLIKLDPQHSIVQENLAGKLEAAAIDHTLHQRTTPTRGTLENFENSLCIMRRIGNMLKDTKRNLADDNDWPLLWQQVHQGKCHVQYELSQAIYISRESNSIDGLKLLSYYGFLVRCSMIWQGLETIVKELGPWDVSSSGQGPYPPMPTEMIHAQG